MLLVQFWIKSSRDVLKFCQIGLAPAARPILEKFPNIKADFHSVQFSERAEFCDCFLFKCVPSAISNEIRST